jgi:chemotaxis signal transduction protein
MDQAQYKDFLDNHDGVIDRLREVALREIDKGCEGIRSIMKELTALQTIATESGMPLLFDCLSDISQLLQSWVADPVLITQLPSFKDQWTDVICELCNYFVFLGEEDEKNLRERVNYRLIQLAKSTAALPPASGEDSLADGSWGLFDEGMVEEAAAAAPAVPMIADLSPVLAAPEKVIPIEAKADAPLDNHLASHYLICLLGSQQYALPIHQVREILGPRNEKPLPSQRSGIRGLVSVRGMVCPVVDVSQILHAKDEDGSESTRQKHCMVVCEVDRRTFCFQVDEVKQVAALDEFEDTITPLNPDNSIQKAISHVSHFQSRSVLFVKMREVIPA